MGRLKTVAYGKKAHHMVFHLFHLRVPYTSG